MSLICVFLTCLNLKEDFLPSPSWHWRFLLMKKEPVALVNSLIRGYLACWIGPFTYLKACLILGLFLLTKSTSIPWGLRHKSVSESWIFTIMGLILTKLTKIVLLVICLRNKYVSVNTLSHLKKERMTLILKCISYLFSFLARQP